LELVRLRKLTDGNQEQSESQGTAEIVKDIGRRQAYDILQSRKPRLHAMSYGENGFRRVLEAAAFRLNRTLLRT